MRLLAFVSLSVLALGTTALFSAAEAACPHPYRASVEQKGHTMTLNYYAEGTFVCMPRPSEIQGVEPGYMHTCSKGQWVPEKGYLCRQDQNDKGAGTQKPNLGPAGASPDPAMSSNQASSGSRHPAGSDNGCAVLRDPEASRRLMERDSSAWLALNGRC